MLRNGNVWKNLRPWSLWKTTPLLVKRLPELVIQAWVGAFVLLKRASNNEDLWFLFSRGACLQWTELGSVYTKNSLHLPHFLLYHGATVMMEVVALHIPMNQSLAFCALGYPCSCFCLSRCLCKLKTCFGSCTHYIFWMAYMWIKGWSLWLLV